MLLIIAMCRKITSHWQPLFSKKMAGRLHFSTKLAAVASFSYKIGGGGGLIFQQIGGGGKDLATLLAAVLTWSGYWISLDNYPFLYDISCESEKETCLPTTKDDKHEHAFCIFRLSLSCRVRFKNHSN